MPEDYFSDAVPVLFSAAVQDSFFARVLLDGAVLLVLFLLYQILAVASLTPIFF